MSEKFCSAANWRSLHMVRSVWSHIIAYSLNGMIGAADQLSAGLRGGDALPEPPMLLRPCAQPTLTRQVVAPAYAGRRAVAEEVHAVRGANAFRQWGKRVMEYTYGAVPGMARRWFTARSLPSGNEHT